MDKIVEFGLAPVFTFHLPHMFTLSQYINCSGLTMKAVKGLECMSVLLESSFD